MAALAYLMNLDFAGGGTVDVAAPGGVQPARVISRQRQYSYGYRYIVKGVQWTLFICS